ncbi:MAG TPA: hypothetical protein VFC60_03290 [Tissierellaceae bacterium]|nr:hypothetical protein [Tissierellaceae bacterium]
MTNKDIVKVKDETTKETDNTSYLAIGISLGLVFGIVLKNIALGLVLGVAIGTGIDTKKSNMN